MTRWAGLKDLFVTFVLFASVASAVVYGQDLLPERDADHVNLRRESEEPPRPSQDRLDTPHPLCGPSCRPMADDAEAVASLIRAAKQGDAQAQYVLGTLYAEGRGVLPRSSVLAAAWWDKAGKHWHFVAVLASTLRLSQTEQAAKHWYFEAEQAAKHRLSEVEASFKNLGEMGDDGADRPNSVDAEAVAALEQAANLGDTQAQYLLGAFYAEGRGVLPRDLALATAWWGKATREWHVEAGRSLQSLAEMGDGWAQYELGARYSERGWMQAPQWLTKAAEQGIARAQADSWYSLPPWTRRREGPP